MDKYQMKALALSVLTATQFVLPTTILQQHHPETDDNVVNLKSVGDVLVHGHVAAHAKTANGYDFNPAFTEIKPMIEEADIAIANLETPIAANELGLGDYPTFNLPPEVAEAVKNAGFDIVSNANNHALDQGQKGLHISLKHLDEMYLPYVGAYKSQKDHDTPRIIEENGVKLGFLAYTYGTNGQVPTADYDVNYIDLKKMKKDIEALKPQVDGVVVSLHMGVEYQYHENKEQQDVAQALSDYGADIILGGHPHALEPMKQDDNSFIIYSQGNFFSGQSQMQTKLGGILSLDIKKTDDGVEVVSGEFLPTYNEGDYNAGGYKTVPLVQSSLDAATKQNQFNFVSDLMTTYDSKVKVVENLSH
ncbi:CapA family protein [Macrococcus equi]|uniref:CapA family protein n=1 Tax=Macrococcus equi TaxID=3395462 RepID=UPI0039BE2D21